MILLVALAIAVVFAQRSQMISQLDAQLESAAPLHRPGPRLDGFDAAPPPEVVPETDQDQPISDIYIAGVLADGTVDVVVQGQLLESTPDVSALTATARSAPQLTTVDSVDGSTRFRVRSELDAEGVLRIIALPMSDVEDTLRQLVVTFLLVGALIFATLAAVAWSIFRLGLRPISEVTDAAQAITAGERDRRAPELADGTEADQLAQSFNLMLDQRDDAEDKLRRFVSDASHELRTPLTSIRGYLDLYSAGAFPETEQLDDAVRRMSAESSRMSNLVENLLQLARLDEEQTLDRGPTDLAKLIEDVVSNSRASYPNRKIEALTGVETIVASVDRAKVQQLLAGLVDNALTHAPDASVRVHIDEQPGAVKLVVADNGPGMTAEDARLIFDRFYRGDSSRVRTIGGSGLGLAIAKSIAEAHDGTIELETSPGKGCRFIVTLPR